MFLLQAILFRIVPTALEISMVCGILVWTQPHENAFLFIPKGFLGFLDI
jgi:hypothetical protein